MISFAVTAYNEMTKERKYGANLLRCIRAAQEHDQIGQIVIVDDGSADYDHLVDLLADEPKVHLYHNHENQGVFSNKLEAIASCPEGWVITCDSDNCMNKKFIDLLANRPKNPSTWYCPSFASPKFDYRPFIGSYDLKEIGKIIHDPMFDCLINTGNQTVYRRTFMRVFGKYRGLRADLMMPNYLGTPRSARGDMYWRLVFDANDSFIFNLEWLLAGNRLNVARHLEYEHYWTLQDESNYIRAPREKKQLRHKLNIALAKSIAEIQ